MILAIKPTSNSLKEYAYRAVQQHLKKTLKWEKSVKKDEHPEALHQMRVGMRRLRTAISRFDLVLNLPRSSRDKKISNIAAILGKLRDIDVLKETLENLYQPHLPAEEQKVLDTALNILGKQRQKALSQTRKTLQGEAYNSLKQGLLLWLDQPIYQPLASLPIEEVLPDLLLPEVSSFLLHPGWLVGTDMTDGDIKVCTNWPAENIEKELTTQGASIHNLRKQAKRLRYQMELFSDLYGESYSAYVAEVKTIQDILGKIQDSVVMGEWLEDVLQSEIDAQVPTLASLLKNNRYQLWQEWRPLQERYLQAGHRYSFHLTVLKLMATAI
ncbi:CHAD domain-containing protein [Anabaenopsis elenkinii]|uniref:CHAD domain-containing protein n=1 Tax=Anabaenopsis elenkinii CCIBt3563 TaxID=2779889 RepID=A0A7U3NMY8_9CYAN|nr:CHAD domain-containing protein [Anabaenopsis elenkinii]QOV21843.1 CHAD domain-containing protein [Anabaenopsis elenkinii CCIBt3563]